MNPRASSLLESFGQNSRLIRRHAEGLTDIGALRQPDFEAISFNWVLGHIVNHRNIALQSLGAESLWSPSLDAAYAHDPAAVTSVEGGLSLAQLLTDLAATEARLTEVLTDITDAFLDEVVDFHTGSKSHFAHVNLYQWHETYHTGQLGLLRSLAMKTG